MVIMILTPNDIMSGGTERYYCLHVKASVIYGAERTVFKIMEYSGERWILNRKMTRQMTKV